MPIDQNSNIPALFSQTLSNCADKTALLIRRDSLWHKLTYRQLDEQASSVAAFLIAEGFKKGDFAGLVLENRPEWAVIYLGIMYAGLTCVPLDIQLSGQELRNLIGDSKAKILFCSYKIFKDKLSDGSNEKLSISMAVVLDCLSPCEKNIIDFSSIQKVTPGKSIRPLISGEDIASLIYTSGTTAKPKGVLLSHGNFCSNFKSIRETGVCLAGDNMLSILPLHHAYAFTATLLTPLFLGAKITYCSSFKPPDLSRIMNEAGVTLLIGVPQLFTMLYKAILEKTKKIHASILWIMLPLIRKRIRKELGKDLRLMVSGGARLEPETARRLVRLTGIKLIEGYGLTEASPLVALNPYKKVKFGSVGLAVPGVDIKINNPDRQGIGQVLIKGENVMRGYFNRPDLTKEAIRGGWLYSGDLGRLDKDGYLYLTGRENEMIVLSSGKNIIPEELEEYYSRTPFVKEICILSVQEEKFGGAGESLYAVVVPDLDYCRRQSVTDIRARLHWEFENLSKSLVGYRRIMGFLVTREKLPRTALGKLKRYEVKEKYLGQKKPEAVPEEIIFSENDLKIFNKQIAEKIIGYLRSQIKKPVYPDSHLVLDLGIDSLSMVELSLGLEALFAIKIPDEAFYGISTVRELIAHISGIIKQKSPEKFAPVTQKTWYELLREPLNHEVEEKISLKSGFFNSLFTFMVKIMLLSVFRILWLLRIKGKQNLPRKGPYIICSNHASFLDGFMIFSSLPFQSTPDLFFLGHNQIFEHVLVRWAISSARLIAVDQNAHLTEAMQAVSFVLMNKKNVCIFPEGKRSIDENLAEFKKGIGILAKELDVPIVCAYIKGSHYSWPRGAKLPRPYPVKVIFGKPLFFKELSAGLVKERGVDDYQAIANLLREEIIRLSREE